MQDNSRFQMRRTILVVSNHLYFTLWYLGATDNVNLIIFNKFTTITSVCKQLEFRRYNKIGTNFKRKIQILQSSFNVSAVEIILSSLAQRRSERREHTLQMIH